MRTVQGCNIHQSLTRDAATIVKQAIHLARRRGHAQVTPIHVATVMLASPAGLLRSACLNNSHPYQCKALELCFNVALNRLPATFNHSHSHSHSHYYPSLANALMAAFKRAQAHQRRGSVDAQQQPILALKIETDQLVISILDDPSVSRVMREAGFSSTLLKSTLLLDHNHIHNHDHNSNSNSNIKVVSLSSSPFDLSFSSSSNALTRSEDVSSVVNQWVKRIDKSSVVVVGECLGSCEGVVRGVKDRVQRGDVPSELRYLQFLNCPLSSMENMSREEIDMKLGEIRCLLKGCVGRGVVLYLGDLKWVTQYWAYYTNSNNSNIEHMVMGLRRLVFGNVEKGRIWLMGISTTNSYINCKSGNPSLEPLLDLLPLTIPSPTLDLTLNLNSNKGCVTRDKFENKIDIEQQTTNSSLPSWLLKCKQESRESSINNNHQEETVEMKELCKKWNLICSNKTSNFLEKTINFSFDNNSIPHSHETEPMVFLSPNSQTHLYEMELKPDLLSNPNSIPNSASSSEGTEIVPTQDRFKENNLENLEALCSAMENKAPSQKHIIPEVATTVLRCRSGRSSKHGGRRKHETWMSFLGDDHEGKLRISMELAKIVFGINSFKSIGSGSGSFSSRNNKRVRGEYGDYGYLERLAYAVREDPHRVFYVEDVEQIDQKRVKKAMEIGKFVLSDGEIISLEDAIVIFVCDSLSSASRACSPPPVKQSRKERELSRSDTPDKDDVDEAISSSLPLDLNIAVDDDDDDDDDVGSLRVFEEVDKQIFFRIQVL